MLLARMNGDVHRVVGISIGNRREARTHAVDGRFFINHGVAPGAA